MLDAMGNGSPISKQIRGPVEPDGVCVVVGSCASGYNEQNNTYSDVIYTGTNVLLCALMRLDFSSVISMKPTFRHSLCVVGALNNIEERMIGS